MPEDNIPSQEIPWNQYTAVFRGIINRGQLLQKSNRANYLQCFQQILFDKMSTFCLWTWLSCCWHLCWCFNVCWWPAADIIHMQTKIFEDEMKRLDVLRWHCWQTRSSQAWLSIALKPKKLPDSRNSMMVGNKFRNARPRPTCVPSFILIRPTVWPQYTNVTERIGQTGQTDRQTTVW